MTLLDDVARARAEAERNSLAPQRDVNLQRKALDALVAGVDLAKVARAAKVTRPTLYRWRATAERKSKSA